MPTSGEEMILIEDFACPYCDFSLFELEPRMFSFNAPYGSCPDCKGLGVKQVIDPNLIMPDKNISIEAGGIKTLGDDNDNMYYKRLECCCKHYNIDMTKPVKDLKKRTSKMFKKKKKRLKKPLQ